MLAVALCWFSPSFVFAQSGSIRLSVADVSPETVLLRLTGPVGERIHANLDNWLLRAPQANPGMLENIRLMCTSNR